MKCERLEKQQSFQQVATEKNWAVVNWIGRAARGMHMDEPTTATIEIIGPTAKTAIVSIRWKCVPVAAIIEYVHGICQWSAATTDPHGALPPNYAKKRRKRSRQMCGKSSESSSYRSSNERSIWQLDQLRHRLHAELFEL